MPNFVYVMIYWSLGTDFIFIVKPLLRLTRKRKEVADIPIDPDEPTYCSCNQVTL